MSSELRYVRTATFQGVGLSHVGCRRQKNEDAILVEPRGFAVADGMGGHRCGEVASGLLVDELRACLFQNGEDVESPAPTSVDRVAEAVMGAAQKIHGIEVDEDGFGAHRPGTTLSGIFYVQTPTSQTVAEMGILGYLGAAEEALPEVASPCWLLANVGDSRTYLLRSGVLSQLTRDHSAIQEMLDLGIMTRQEIERSPHRGVITRAIGASSGPEPQVDYWLVPVCVGDRFLICSDGVNEELSFAKLQQILLQDSAEQAVLQIRDECLRVGARDNLSAVVVDVVA